MKLSISPEDPEYLMSKAVMNSSNNTEHSTKHVSVKGIGRLIITSKLIYIHRHVSKCWLKQI